MIFKYSSSILLEFVVFPWLHYSGSMYFKAFNLHLTNILYL